MKIERLRSCDATLTSIDQCLSAAIGAAISGMDKLSYQEAYYRPLIHGDGMEAGSITCDFA